MQTDLSTIQLSQKQFEKISKLLYEVCGINLNDGKDDLVRARLTKRLRLLQLDSFEKYLEYLQADKTGAEMSAMVDCLTTNKTHFFRESQHFEYLRQHVLPALCRRGGRIRIWCAGCSSGEEPYSLAMLLREELVSIDRMDIKILATDICTRVLEKARQAVYDRESVMEYVPPQICHKYFYSEGTKSAGVLKVNESVRKMISFARLNLMESWPMKGPFDIIFCRNVMIYFDKPTQERLVNRFWEMLAADGYLFVGHSESLASSTHKFRYVRPAVYLKNTEPAGS